MKAVFLDYATMGPDLDLAPLNALFDELIIHQQTDDAEIAERVRDADFVFTNKNRLFGEALSDAVRLRYVGLTATGTDNVDVAAARARGVAVSNIRDYCTQSVVEHVFGVLLMLAHSLPAYVRDVREGRWQTADNFCMLTHPVRQLSTLTLGIVGFGTLGQGVLRLAKAFGMTVLVAARAGSATVPADRVSLDELLARADVISLHCPLNEQTRHLLDADALAKTRRGVFIVNTARGALIDSKALCDALASGQVAGAAVDVLAAEPPVDGDALLEYDGDNLLITPHMAWGTQTARQNAIDQLADNAAAFLRGERQNRVD